MALARNRRALLVTFVPVIAVAVAVAATFLAVSGNTRAPAAIAFSTSADPANGADYTREAIDNLRQAERFRFKQAVTGAGSAANPASGEVEGEVDLANASNDTPKYRSTMQLKRPDGSAVAFDTVAIGDELNVRQPGKSAFAKSAKGPKKAKGKKAGRSEDVDVIDPVMQLLEPVDSLPSAAFGTPSAVDGDGNRTVDVTMPQGTLTLTIDDTIRVVEQIEFVIEGRTAAFTLSGFGDAIEIEDPTP